MVKLPMLEKQKPISVTSLTFIKENIERSERVIKTFL